MFKKKDGFNTTDDFNRRINQATLSGKKQNNRPKRKINLSALITPVFVIVLGYIVSVTLMLIGILPSGSMPSWLPFSKQINLMTPFMVVDSNSENVWQQDAIVSTSTPTMVISFTPSITLTPTISLTPTITMTPTPLINLDNPTVICNDDFLRHVEYQQGACSLHGGIKELLQPIPVLPPSE